MSSHTVKRPADFSPPQNPRKKANRLDSEDVSGSFHYYHRAPHFWLSFNSKERLISITRSLPIVNLMHLHSKNLKIKNYHDSCKRGTLLMSHWLRSIKRASRFITQRWSKRQRKRNFVSLFSSVGIWELSGPSLNGVRITHWKVTTANLISDVADFSNEAKPKPKHEETHAEKGDPLGYTGTSYASTLANHSINPCYQQRWNHGKPSTKDAPHLASSRRWSTAWRKKSIGRINHSTRHFSR